MRKFNLNGIYPDDKEWIEKVSNDWETLITDWIQDYKNGIKTKEDVLSVAEKVARYRNDESLIEEVKQRMGN